MTLQDMNVAVPVGVVVRVVAHAGSTSDDISDVTVEADELLLRTIRRRGARPSGPANGGLGSGLTGSGLPGSGASGQQATSPRAIEFDGDLRSIAGTAVAGLLLSLILPGTPDIRERTETAVEHADQLGALLFDHVTWETGEVLVDGTVFALLSVRLPEGFAAVADLGPCFVAVWGARQPETWQWTMTPLATLPSAF